MLIASRDLETRFLRTGKSQFKEEEAQNLPLLEMHFLPPVADFESLL